MSVTKPGAVAPPRPAISRQASRLVSAVERFVAARSERALIIVGLAGFFVLRTLFHIVSNIAVSVNRDTSEAAEWAQHFAFGYKHPPLTAWIFSLWFSVFPRSDFAVYLLSGVLVTCALAVTWRLLRDHLDMNRAMVGLAALVLVPFYVFLSPVLDANTVMMPFWPAALLFYLRAHRGHGLGDAALAGAFAGLTFLGKYWAIWLLAGMAAASVTGAGTMKFWRSPVPWVMGASAAAVVAPHLHWYLTTHGGANYAFVTRGALIEESFVGALATSGRYLAGSVAYVCVPLMFLAALRPDRAALADIVWPRDAVRRQALVLLAVPLLLPPLVNLVLPQRLTPLWTIPDWPLLPVILFGSPLITGIDMRAVARVLVVALAVLLGAVAASPVTACIKMQRKFADDDRAYFEPVAAAVEEFGRPVRSLWGSRRIVKGLLFYIPEAVDLHTAPAVAGIPAEARASGVVIVCSLDDAPCLAAGAAFAAGRGRTKDITVTRTLFGFAAPPLSYRIIVVPPQRITDR